MALFRCQLVLPSVVLFSLQVALPWAPENLLTNLVASVDHAVHLSSHHRDPNNKLAHHSNHHHNRKHLIRHLEPCWPKKDFVSIMNSLPTGTPCAYCGVREAQYIPDGCAGPLCMDPDGESCFDLCESRGWDYVCGLRYARWTAARFGTLAKSLPPPLDTIGQAVAEFSVRVDNGHMPFCLDERSSSRGAPQPASPLPHPRGAV